MKRPQCSFGRRMPAMDPIEPYLLLASDGTWEELEEPEGWAVVVLSQLQERVMAAKFGLPKVCDPDSITWI